jgi:dCMP deaminase
VDSVIKSRKSWDEYFLDLAYMAATRATCPRRFVGAVLTKDKKVLGTAYNGSPSHTPSCLEEGCLLVNSYEPELSSNGSASVQPNEPNEETLIIKQNCIRTIHAEQNLILFTDRSDREGASVYVTDQPCWTCANLLANSGVVEIVYHRPYAKDRDKVLALMDAKGILFRQLENYHPPFGTDGVVVD